MNTGIPVEIVYGEGRVALIPEACSILTSAGHRVFMETRAGAGSGYSDEDCLKAGIQAPRCTGSRRAQHPGRGAENSITGYVIGRFPYVIELLEKT